MTSMIVSLALALRHSARPAQVSPRHRSSPRWRRPDHAARPRLRLGLPQRQPRRLRLGGLRHSTCRWAPTGPREYYFPRYLAVPPDQMFMPTLLQPLRHPRPALHSLRGLRRRSTRRAARPSARPTLPTNPTTTRSVRTPRPLPAFTGRVEAPPVNPAAPG